MSDITYLNGRVLKRSLPVINGRPANDAPRLKRLLLAQGELAQLYDDNNGIRYLAYIELRQGAIRGNHYHKVKHEFIYVICGRILLVVEDRETAERASIELVNGDLVDIPVTIAHAFRTLEGGHGLEFSAEAFDVSDIFQHSLITGDLR